MEYNEKFWQEIHKLKLQIEANIESNTDPRPKEVGDRIRIWDGSTLVDSNGKSLSGNDVKDMIFIIIEKDGNYPVQESFFPTTIYKNDLKVASVDNPNYIVYTCSEMVQLEDFKTPEKLFDEMLKG